MPALFTDLASNNEFTTAIMPPNIEDHISFAPSPINNIATAIAVPYTHLTLPTKRIV